MIFFLFLFRSCFEDDERVHIIMGCVATAAVAAYCVHIQPKYRYDDWRHNGKKVEEYTQPKPFECVSDEGFDAVQHNPKPDRTKDGTVSFYSVDFDYAKMVADNVFACQ